MATPLLPPSTQSGKIVGKKISTQSLFGKNKKSGAIVKTSGSSIKLRPKISSSIIKASPSLDKESQDGSINRGKNIFQEVNKTFFSIKDTLDNLVNLFLNRNIQKNKDVKEERKKDEKEKKEKEELKLEKPKIPKVSGVKTPSLPKFNFLDTIFNFFGSILLGSLLNFMLSKKNFIFAALDDILDGFNNVFNLMKFAITSLTNTANELVKNVAKIGSKLLKGPAQLTGSLLSKLGKSIKNLLVKTGKAISSFVGGTFKNISGMAAGAASTRATGVAKRGLGAVTRRGLPRAGVRGAAAIGGRPAASFVKRSEKLFGEKGAKHLAKVSGVFKKIPFIGALIGIGIDLAMGERLDNAVAGAVGASLGAAIGGAIGTAALPIPGVGTFLGGLVGAAIGDWAGKEIYRNISGQVSQINPKPEDLGTPTPEPPAGPSAGGGGAITSAAIPAEGKALLDAIAGAEGDYNSRYPSKTFSGYADHPRIKERTPWGTESDAAGRYQFMSSTWDKYKPAKEFTPENQDIAAWRLATAVYGYGESGLVNALKKDPMQVAAKLRGTWPSLPGGSQQNVHTSGYLSRYQNALKKYQGVSVGPSKNVGMQYQTNTYRNQYYGAPRPGRKHAGVDLQMYSNSKQITFLGGKVINIGNDPGGYYTYIDILTPTGKIERLAELGRLDSAVKKGAVLAPGQVVSHGVGPTGVTHLEYRNPGTSGFSGTTNPLEYLRSVGAIFGGDRFQYKGGPDGAVPSSQIAQVPRQPTQSLTQEARQLTQQASYEGQQQIVPIPIPMGGGSTPPIIGGGGGGGIIPVGLSKREALNSYYQAQLIGFLYKQG
jgi:muramidase (phage lysozyme)